MPDTADSSVDRRAFLASAGATCLLGPAAIAAARRDTPLTVGVIGCGGRGSGAARNALEASPEVRIAALGDLFPERLERCRSGLAAFDAARGSVDDAHCFVGFDAYRGVLACDCDLVILATPPGFRPAHFAAAIAAGKHVFMEKPAAVDPTGVRQVLAAAEEADRRGLRVVAGTQRRYENSYLAAIDRLRAGDLGTPVAGRCFWNMGGLWHEPTDPARSEMENQCRNWLYHAWLSGDHIVEQHVHNIDVLNWAFDAMPQRAVGVGGRQARTGAEFGEIYDHFAIEYRYPGGEWAMGMCRQQPGTPGRVEESVTGTEAMLLLRPGFARIDGARSWRFTGANNDPFREEHVVLQRAIRESIPHNDAPTMARSTLAAIMGREAAYTGQEITVEAALASEQDLMPAVLAFAELPQRPVPIPGRTRFR